MIVGIIKIGIGLIALEEFRKATLLIIYRHLFREDAFTDLIGGIFHTSLNNTYNRVCESIKLKQEILNRL